MTTADNEATGPEYRDDDAWARAQDAQDPLNSLRSDFLFPHTPSPGDPKAHSPGDRAAPGGEVLYFAGHSLGLQPRKARSYVLEELDDWARLGVEGHFAGRHPWLGYHELLTAPTARLVGALPDEVVVMNTLSVNLHLMMVSFYRPTAARHRILIEARAFPSDRYAVDSQARFHGFDPDEAILQAANGEEVLRQLDEHGDSIALVLIGGVNYLSGEAFDIEAIARAGHARGCLVGFDLAHAVGNLPVRLHDHDADFAVWCNYKYLNAGPGGLGGCFVHQRHAQAALPRFAGWWGHDKATRFAMGPVFKPIAGAEGWQLSNPPILPLAVLRASMELFDQAGIERLRAKSLRLTGYLEWLIDRLPEGHCELLTPRDPARRGAMLSLKIAHGAQALATRLAAQGALCDYRQPDMLRIAPAPLYCGFADVQRLAGLLRAFWSAND